LLSVTKNDSATFQHKQEDAPTRNFQLHVGDSLSQIADELTGLTIQTIDKNTIELSNGQIKTVGEEMDVDVFMNK
jgi:type III restriction enzyme